MECRKAEGRGYGWHQEIAITKNDKTMFRLTTNHSGCGSMILSSWTTANPEYFKEQLSKFLERLDTREFIPSSELGSRMDIGSIVTTAGNSYYDDKREYMHENLQTMIDLGFREVAEYNNPRHGSGRQKMYVWTIKDN